MAKHLLSQSNAFRSPKKDQEPRLTALECSSLRRLFPEGINRGNMLSLQGGFSSGQTAVCQHILSLATAHGEICAVIDLNNSFYPEIALAAGIRLDRVVWIRCQKNVKHALRACDLLLHAGGFGVINLDLCGAHQRELSRVPFSYWYRLSKALKQTPTILLVSEHEGQALSRCQHSLRTTLQVKHWTETGLGDIFTGTEIHIFAEKRPWSMPLSLLLKRG